MFIVTWLLLEMKVLKVWKFSIQIQILQFPKRHVLPDYYFSQNVQLPQILSNRIILLNNSVNYSNFLKHSLNTFQLLEIYIYNNYSIIINCLFSPCSPWVVYTTYYILWEAGILVARRTSLFEGPLPQFPRCPPLQNTLPLSLCCPSCVSSPPNVTCSRTNNYRFIHSRRAVSRQSSVVGRCSYESG